MVKWNWLVPDSEYALRKSIGFRISIACLASVLPLLMGFSLIFVAGGYPPAGIVLVVLGVLTVLWGPFEPQLRKLHYLHGLDTYDQKHAIEWYETLSAKERRQLPDGWAKAVREVGAQALRPNRYISHTVARNLHEEANKVIDLYREKNAELKVVDSRIELFNTLMKERQEELSQDIKDRKEIEAKIKAMP